ncbi:MAG: RNA 2',3'-cyclic phosphodiesterase [Syntrophus sp. SKADARSKE-3]|nr:RNA 2',3'-cyclic phosphodiesterase [Syntrophus sp. SKADARSKE-3]
MNLSIRTVMAVLTVLALSCSASLVCRPAYAGAYFLALEIPDDTKASIANRQKFIADNLTKDQQLETGYDYRDHPADNLHMTLVEFYEEDPRGTNFNKAMEEIMREAEVFHLEDKMTTATLHTQGAQEGKQGYIVYNLVKHKKATKFVELIREKLKLYRIRFKEDRKDFRDQGHVSIAKYNGKRTAKEYLETRFGTVWPPACQVFRVTGFVLKQSNAPKSPRIYTTIGAPYIFKSAISR